MFASKMLLCPCLIHQAVIQHQPHCTQWNVQMSALIYGQGGQYCEFCREGTEGKSLSMNPGSRGVKEVYLNLMHKVRGQPDKKVSVSLSAGEMVVLRRLSEVKLLPPLFQLEKTTKVQSAMTCIVPLLFLLQGMLDMTTIPVLLQCDNHPATQTHLLLLQYVIPYLLGFDEIFQYDGGADAGPSDGLGADWARPVSNDAAPVAMPTSAPF